MKEQVKPREYAGRGYPADSAKDVAI